MNDADLCTDHLSMMLPFVKLEVGIELSRS